jgi:hypothetical protein
VKRTLFLAEVVACVAWLGVPTTHGDPYAVTAPDTQTVAINGDAAQFDGSGP